MSMITAITQRHGVPGATRPRSASAMVTTAVSTTARHALDAGHFPAMSTTWLGSGVATGCANDFNAKRVITGRLDEGLT